MIEAPYKPDHSTIPEWHADRALFVGWPENYSEWGVHLSAAQSDMAAFIELAANVGTDVTVCSGTQTGAAGLAERFHGVARTLHISMGDIWLRDTGPIFTQNQTHSFAFNGWGGKFNMAGDTLTSASIAEWVDTPHIRHDWVLEGGAIDSNGAGMILTTRQCLLNANRGVNRTVSAIEDSLAASLGVDRVIWLNEGLVGDHTDGHIDNLARFVSEDHIVCQAPSGLDDPNADIYADIFDTLAKTEIKITPIPSPGRIVDSQGNITPASHMNFVILPNAVIMPKFEDVYYARAMRELEDIFPDKKIIATSARALIEGGGGFHCASLHVPKKHLKTSRI